MPQMSPMYLLMLMFYFMMIMMLIMTFIYFSFLKSPKIELVNYSKLNFNWKW